MASGDPLTTAVVIWTRVTPRGPAPGSVVQVRWRVMLDGPGSAVLRSGLVTTSAARDYTVKVDVTGLEPGRTYRFAFDAEGETSPVGRTRTLPAATAAIRLAVVSCANYSGGYFNVYAAIAARNDLDAVVHLGDYIYEFREGYYGDSSLGRRLEPAHETVSLQDYRQRYACSRRDPDLQEVHRLHPFIAIWDDHELADNAWTGGALGHEPRSEGNWGLRRANAMRAYREWLPVRETGAQPFRLYRAFQFGQIARLNMLDTRSFRSAQVEGTDIAGLARQSRRLLGIPQEQWLYESLRGSAQSGVVWNLIGQGVLFSPLTPPGRFVQLPDGWDGYQAERGRLREFFGTSRNVVVLTGDMHSSWAFEVPPDPWSGYQADTGAGSVAVELVTPAISSAPFFSPATARTVVPSLRANLPHLKYLEGVSRGYILLEVTRERLLASFYHVPDVTRRSPAEVLGAAFSVRAGTSHLERA